MCDEAGPKTRIWEQTWAIGGRSRSGPEDKDLRDWGGDNTRDSKRKVLFSWQTLCKKCSVISFHCQSGSEATIVICYVSGKTEAPRDHTVFQGLPFKDRADIHQV